MTVSATVTFGGLKFQIEVESRWVEEVDWKMGSVWWVAMQLYG